MAANGKKNYDRFRKILQEIRKKDVYEEKYLEVDLILYMNEKEVAILCFPTLNGDYDFIGFTSRDPESHEWCKDLFYHHWEKARRIH